MLKAILIDDEKWSRNVIKSFGKWDELGIAIVGEAEDGEEGLLLVDSLLPDIIITDMNMPNIDGIQLLQTLANREIEAKVIIISGYDDYAYMKQAIQSKAFEYLLKPIDAKELNKVLKDCIHDLSLNGLYYEAPLYENIDKNWLNQVANHRKQIDLWLEQKNSLQFRELMTQLIQLAKERGVDQALAVKVLEDYYHNLIQERVILPLGDKSLELSRSYGEMRKRISKGMLLEEFEKSIIGIVETGFNHYFAQIQSENQSVVIQTKTYIDLHFREAISLDKIATIFFASKEYLSSAFKAKYQINISQYILDLKMAEAIRLLKANGSHASIAKVLGYQDLNYFYKVFKKYYGKTPGEYWEED